jgi:hypothetical protein
LLEVLVASGVLAVVLAILLGTMTTTMSLWRNTEAKAASDREVRAAELLLDQDLANVVMPASVNLWPRTVTNGGTTFLQFLTKRSADYQGGASNTGDVCYVEYAVVASPTAAGHELRRLFWESERTYREILIAGSLRGGLSGGGVTINADFQPLGLNLLADNRQAVRGLVLADEANRTNFVILSTNHSGAQLLPLAGAYAPTNRPVAIEVNFAVTDAESLQNPDLLSNTNFVLRSAGLYSTRFYLPVPQSAP